MSGVWSDDALAHRTPMGETQSEGCPPASSSPSLSLRKGVRGKDQKSLNGLNRSVVDIALGVPYDSIALPHKILQTLSLGLAILLLAYGCATPAELASGKQEARPQAQPAVAQAQPASRPDAVGLPAVADVVERVRPAVVSIIVRVVSEGTRAPIRGTGIGTGVIFNPDGYILTNNHVVEDSTQISVVLPDERTVDAKIVGRDPFTDLAVLKVNEQRLPVAKLGNSDHMRIGEWVIAIGNALALQGGPSVTVGVVSALGRSVGVPGTTIVLHDMVQTDAAINVGNSGGPLLNLQGEVIGINTVIVSEAQGIGFAVGTSTALPIMEQLVANGRVIWPWLGVSVEEITPARALQLNLAVNQGVLVRGVERDTPAQKAGLRSGDIIVDLEEKSVVKVRDLQNLIRQRKVGDTVNLTYLREGKKTQVAVKLAEMPRGL